MVQTHHFATRRQRLFSLALLGCACAVLPLRSARAQNTAAASYAGEIKSTGPSQYFEFEGSGEGSYAGFGLMDFSASSFGLTNTSSINGVQGGTMTLNLTEDYYKYDTSASLEFYLTTDNTVSTSSLTYQNPNLTDPPYGIDPKLGSIASNSTLFDLGQGQFSNSTSNPTDTFTLSLSTAATQALINSLSSTGGGDVRLVAVTTTAKGEVEFFGTNATNSNQKPTLTFTPTYSTANNLYWEAGSGTWSATGGTNFNTTSTTTGNAAWNNDGTHVAVFNNTANSTVGVSSGIHAAGLEFDITGYTLSAATAGNTLALTGTAPTVQVTNASDVATINVPLAGTVGMNKTGMGTLVLGGANTYTGGTTITSGTLQIGIDSNLGDTGSSGTPGAVTLSGGTLHVSATDLTTARAFSGTGGLQVDDGHTLTISGVANFTAVTLTGASTFALVNNGGTLASGASNAVGTVTFASGGATLTTSSNGTTADGQGTIALSGVTASQTSGKVTINGNALVSGSVTVSVPNAAATATINGAMAGTGEIIKNGAGTLVLTGDNSGLTAGTNGTTFQQGVSGTTPASGGVVSIAAGNSNPNSALGSGAFNANGGTISNDSGQAVVLTTSILSIGAQNATGTPGGLILAGANGITFNGSVSLYRSSTAAYQHALTVNTPTTFTGLLSTTTTTPQTGTVSLGLTIAGTSTLTLQGTTPNTINVPITVATTGSGGMILAAAGALGSAPSITINAGANLTVNTGATSGTVDTINDAALVSFASNAGAFGKITLTIGSGTETVGGLYLATGEGALKAGYQPAGTYGSTASGATYQDNTLFSGTGLVYNLDTAFVPEPSTWTAALAGLGVLGWLGKRRRAQG